MRLDVQMMLGCADARLLGWLVGWLVGGWELGTLYSV